MNINLGYWAIMAFYVILIGVFMMIGASVAKIVNITFEVIGFIIGAVIGVLTSLWLWNNYGKQMVNKLLL